MKTWPMILCSFVLASCAGQQSPSSNDAATASIQNLHANTEIERAIALISVDWPALPDSLPTTDGEIYLGNLNSQINVIDGNPALRQRTSFKVTLAGLLYQRFQIEGRIADAEQARSILDSAHSDREFAAADHLVYAKILLGFHDFDGASKQLILAESKGVSASGVAAIRTSLNQALRLPVKGQNRYTGVSGNYGDTVQYAATLLNKGRLAETTAQLKKAQELYRDSSPFPLAWIHVQQGIAFLRYGEHEQARRFFAAAHERFPQYYLATEPLAETEGLLGNHERSAELYRLVTAQNDQPGFWFGLAQAEEELGNTQAAQLAAQRAELGYQNLLTRYPLMYADHAVGYYLETGNPGRALELAELNFEHRKDLMAHLALAEATMRNGREEAACEQVQAIRDAGLAPPEISLAGETLANCRRAR